MANLNWKYKIIPKLLNATEIKLAHEYCKERHIKNTDNFDEVQNNCGDTKFYKDSLMQVFLKSKKKILEKNINLKLHETYTFWRCYTYGADLKKHKDRPSCEISVTVFIGSDGEHEWPIYMDGKKVNLTPGDGVIYRGCDIEHWREPYEGDYHMQVFLHYVDANGKYANHKGDVINENFTE
tara:strand:- start:313 stop:855 length:543 start_codon:yes stop_codon:yes gene_type:complete